MQTITYTQVRKQLADTLTQVCDNHEPAIVTRRQHPSVVILSLDDYNALTETAYLLRSPNNASRLFDAIEELNTGRGMIKSLSMSENVSLDSDTQGVSDKITTL